jgi:methyl-accepting chemotaxis protein
MVILVVYVDLRFLVGLGVYALLVNVVLIVRKALAGQLTESSLTNAEVIIACLILTTVFILMAIKKIEDRFEYFEI